MKSKYELQADFKSSGTAFIMWFFLGAHYAYMGKWGIQFLYWFSLGGLGLWAFIDLFRISGIVKRHNLKLGAQIEEIDEKKHEREMEKLVAMK